MKKKHTSGPIMLTIIPLGKTADERAAAVHKVISANAGVAPEAYRVTGPSSDSLRENILLDLRASVQSLDAMRLSSNEQRCIDISFETFVKERWGFGTLDNFYSAIGLNPAITNINQLMTRPDFDDSMRWLIPEVIREAVRLGLRKSPLYPQLTAAEESVNQPLVTMPHINMSDATMQRVGEAETIPVGTVSFGQKQVTLFKVAKGITMSDEVIQYVNLNVLSVFLQDVGVKLGLSLDTLAIDVLINGDQANGSGAASVVGVTVPGALSYRDFVRVWMRMQRLGRGPSGFLANETPALDALMVDEFKNLAGKAKLADLAMSTPLPASQSVWVNGNMPSTNKVMFVDPTSALMRLTSAALRVESERIARKQISGTYVSLTTGFANLFRDARLIMDKSLDIATNGFPSYMDVGAAETDPFTSLS